MAIGDRRDRKSNLHHGGTETRRKPECLSRIDADGRGSESEFKKDNSHSRGRLCHTIVAGINFLSHLRVHLKTHAKLG